MKWLYQKLRLKRVWIVLSLVYVILIYTVIVNWCSLIEGVGYLLDGMMYKPAANHPVRKDGPFGITHDLVSLSSQERMEMIKRILVQENVEHYAIPVDDRYENIFVPGNLSNTFILIEAHYDKKVDDPSFHAATDNTGSVAVLLAVIRNIKLELNKRPVAFLFTALEEQGFIGAYHFIKYAREKGYRINGALCLDMVGRGMPVVVTPADAAGFRFHIPFYGSLLFNGQQFAKAPYSFPIDKSLVDAYLPNIDIYRAVLSSTDANAFLEAGIPAIHVAGDNMWHADQVWGQYTDTIDRLDEHDLLECNKLIEKLVRNLK